MSRGRVDDLVDKYMEMFAIPGDPPPIQIRDNLGSPWLGRTTWGSRSGNIVVELQKQILNDDETLERVLAHEMNHVFEFRTLTQGDIAAARLGIKLEAHGAEFKRLAAAVNGVMGPDFVTVDSDKTYVQSQNTRAFFVLIVPVQVQRGGAYGYQWAAKLGPKAAEWVKRRESDGGRLVRTTDERWTRVPKIKPFAGYAVPRDPADMDLLVTLYETGEQVEP